MRVRTCFVLLLCLLACGGCGKEIDRRVDRGSEVAVSERDRIIAVRLLPQRTGDAAQIVPALIEALKDKEGDVR